MVRNIRRHRHRSAATAPAAPALSGCTPSADDNASDRAAGETQPAHAAATPGSATTNIAWRHIALVEGAVPGGESAVAAEDQRSLGRLWTQAGFDGAAPTPNFSDYVYLFVSQSDDNCPDEIVAIAVTGRRMRVQWQGPEPCEDRATVRVHAIELARRGLPSAFTVGVQVTRSEQFKRSHIRLQR